MRHPYPPIRSVSSPEPGIVRLAVTAGVHHAEYMMSASVHATIHPGALAHIWERLEREVAAGTGPNP